MNTILVWLLVSLPGYGSNNANVPAVTVARFADLTECQRVRAVMREGGGTQPTMCIQARVVP